MTTTIQKMLCPLFIMCFIVGLHIYPVQHLKPRYWWITYLSILYALIVWLLCIYFSYYTATLFTIETLNHIIVIVIELIYIVAAITATLISFYHQKGFLICIKKFAMMDDTLKEMGTPKTYSKLHMLSKIIIIAWIAWKFIAHFYDVIMLMRKGASFLWGTFAIFMINYPSYINELMELLLIYLLWHIRIRFDKINKHIQWLQLVKQEHWLCIWKKSTAPIHQHISCINNYKRILWTSIHLHLELCRITRKVSLIFGMQISCIMASYFLYLTTTCYFLCLMLTNERKIVLHTCFKLFAWFTIFITKFFAINYFFESIKTKANKIKKLIHQLSINRYADLYVEIYHFTLQTMLQPLEFTGVCLFNFGNQFLQKFCTTIVMYVIIMVEMQIVMPNVFLQLEESSNATNILNATILIKLRSNSSN